MTIVRLMSEEKPIATNHPLTEALFVYPCILDHLAHPRQVQGGRLPDLGGVPAAAAPFTPGARVHKLSGITVGKSAMAAVVRQIVCACGFNEKVTAVASRHDPFRHVPAVPSKFCNSR